MYYIYVCVYIYSVLFLWGTLINYMWFLKHPFQQIFPISFI